MKSVQGNIKGHASALITILIWGTTFISTKLLLTNFKPIEILFYRFCIGLLILLIVHPRFLRNTTKKQEITFAAAGLCGITLYYLLENIALNYTWSSNVGIIVSVAPFLTVLLNWVFEREKPKFNFFIGFIISIAGIILISYNGSVLLHLNPIGDILAFLAAIVWAFYSILSKKISQFKYNAIQVTKRTFFYGILFMTPMLLVFHFNLGITRFAHPVNIFNILFLGLGASALCFVTWNLAVRFLGAVKTSIYIYIVPVVTVITSAIVLHEKITWMTVGGVILTLGGLFLSETKSIFQRGKKNGRTRYEMCDDN